MEDILKRTDGQLSTLEQLVHDIEFSQIEVSVVEGLRVGSAALKQLNSMMSIENIQQILEDNEEAADKQKEISRLLSDTDRYEEGELMEELSAMSEKVSLKLPQVPTHIPEPEQSEHIANIPPEREAVPSNTDQEELKPKKKQMLIEALS